MADSLRVLKGQTSRKLVVNVSTRKTTLVKTQQTEDVL
jgi:hypothetical protein